MTYPPDEHVLRDLEIESWLEALDHCGAELPVLPPVLDASGRVALGALLTLVDIACARVVFRAAAPNWIATADLSVTSGVRPRDGVVRAEGRLVRAGSKLMVVDVDLGPVGMATGTFVRIPREASLVERELPSVGERTTMERSGPRLTQSLVERMGLRAADGVAVLDRHDYVGNSFGTINGGIMGFLVAAAAESAAGGVAADVTLRYLGQTKVGPAQATARVIRDGVCDVHVRDAGADGAILARAIVTTTR